MKYNLICFIVSLTLVYNCKETSTDQQIEVITAEEMQQMLSEEGIQFVDVRTPEEYQEEHIEGFQNIDYFSDTFEADLEKLDKSKPVILYCRSGKRSSKCAEIMKEKGFVKIFNLEGGITKWKYKGYEVSKVTD